jgi:hypothetical protein
LRFETATWLTNKNSFWLSNRTIKLVLCSPFEASHALPELIDGSDEIPTRSHCAS